MTPSRKKLIKVHTFSPLPPLSLDELYTLWSVVSKKEILLACEIDRENGPTVPHLTVLDGNWRLVEQELKRMGRDFNEPVPYWLTSDEAGPA